MSSAAPARPRALEQVLTTVAILAGLAIVVASALSVGEASKAIVVLPLVVGAGLMLAAVGLRNFASFVIIMLILRSSLDLAKLSESSGLTEATMLRMFDPSSIVAVLFVLMAVLWLAARCASEGRVPGSPLRAALLVFLAAGAVSVLGSTRPLAGIFEVVRIASAVLMFVVVEQLASNPAWRRQIVLAVYASALFPLAFSVVGLLTGTARMEPKGEIMRLEGTFVQSNDFGRYLMLLVIMGVALYPHLERRLQRPLSMLLVACSGCLLLTYTLSATIGTVVGLLVVGLVQSRRVLAGLLAVSVLALVLLPSLTGRLGEIAHVDDSDKNSSLDWRVAYWVQVLPLANTNPLSGIGLGQTQYMTEQEKQPHNDFVRAYVETGLIGLVAYACMLFWLMRTAWRAVKDTAVSARRRSSLDRGLAVGFLGCVTAFLAASLVANLFSGVVVLWYFFAFAAAASVGAAAGATPGEEQFEPVVQDVE